MAKTYFVVCSLLLPLNATFVHNDIFRLGILNLDMGRMGIFAWGVGRVR
jgi:Mg2+/citrate symporter